MRKVAIVGMAPLARVQVKELAPDYEIWGMNDSHHWLERADRWFEIHPKGFIEDAVAGRGEFTRRVAETHLDWLKSTDIPLYMGQRYEEFPSSIAYPAETIIAKHCPRDENGVPYPYFTSTFPYMIALAIEEGVDEITLLGGDLSSTDEYVDQRPCVEWWLGYAMGRGIRVIVRKTSPVMWGPPYGFMTGDVERLQDMAQKRVDEAKDAYLTAYGQMVHIIAVYEERLWTLGKLRNPSPETKKFFEDRLRKTYTEVKAREQTLHAQLGKLRDAQHWLATLGFKDVHPGKLPILRIPEGEKEEVMA